MRVAICDTEPRIMGLVEGFIISDIKKNNEELFISKYDSAITLSDDISDKADFDVCFIHAEMSGLNGVETTKEIKKYRPDCMVVIYATTDKYSIAAWNADAFFYLLMPPNGSDIERVLERARNSMNLTDREYLRLKLKDGWYHVPYRNILYIESEAHKVNFVLTNKECLTVYTKLDSLEELLSDSERFIRIHKSVLMNGMYIKKFSAVEVICSNGEEFRVSRNAADNAKVQYDKYIAKLNMKTVDR